MTPEADLVGTVRVDLPAERVRDVLGYANPAAAGLVVPVDLVAPRLVSVVGADPARRRTSADRLVFTLRFDEPVTGLDPADLATRGGAGAVTGVRPRNDADDADGAEPARVFRATVEGAGLAGHNGEIGLGLAANAVLADAAGNALTASLASGTRRELRSGQPRSGDDHHVAGQPAGSTWTCGSTFTDDYRGEPEGVTDFTVEDIEVTNATKGQLTGMGSSYTLTVTPTGGHITISVPANVAVRPCRQPQPGGGGSGCGPTACRS